MSAPQRFRLLVVATQAQIHGRESSEGVYSPLYPLGAGDAARGAGTGFLVGGIVTGMRGALGVADSVTNGGYSRELAALRWELNWHLLLRRMLHRFTQADYSRLLDLLSDPARRSLSAHDRDAAAKILWRLCVRQPRLALLGLRGFLTGGSILPAAPSVKSP